MPLVFTRQNVTLTDAKERIVLGLNDQEAVCIRGMVSVRVYSGRVDILGSQLNADATYHKCFAAKSSSAIEIRAIETTSSKRISLSRLSHIEDKKQELEAEKLARDLARDFPIVVVFKAIPIDYTNIDCFVESPLGFQFVGCRYVAADETHQHNLYPFLASGGSGRKIAILDSWEALAEQITVRISNHQQSPSSCDMTKIIICGSKGVGKSTFGRYLINKVLQVTPVIAYLDTDVGQPEYTAPGMVSLQLITTPLLGPAHTHMKRPFRAYDYGYLSSKSDPQKYVRILRCLFSEYLSKWGASIPLIVNTDGWVKGMGCDILANTIDMIEPTDVVRIEGITAGTTIDLPVRDNHRRLASWTDGGSSHGASCAKLERLYRLRAYFLGQEEMWENAVMIASSSERVNQCTAIELSRIVPHQISLRHVRVHFPGHRIPSHDLLSAALCGRVVGLCLAPPHDDSDAAAAIVLDDDPIAPCVGLGIIRGINARDQVVYLLTPVPTDILRHVTIVVKNQQELPLEFLQQASIVTPPYCATLSALDGRGTGASVMQSRNNLKRKYL